MPCRRSAATGVVAAARARVTGARALHLAAALVTGRAELEVGADLGRDDRRGFREGRRRRLGLRLRLRGAVRLALAVALAVRMAVAAVRGRPRVVHREGLLSFLPRPYLVGHDPEALQVV